MVLCQVGVGCAALVRSSGGVYIPLIVVDMAGNRVRPLSFGLERCRRCPEGVTDF